MRISFRISIAALICFCLITACSTSPTGRKQLMLVTPNQAISASKEAYVEALKPLEKDGKIDSNSEVTKRVRHITGRIVAQAIKLYPNTNSWDWSIKVIDDPDTVNAWCMAGGKMAIYTGLINKVKPSDGELAQVMGHEIAHALANHTAEKMSVAMASEIGVAGLAIASSNSKYNKVVLTGAPLAAAVAVTLPNSRAAETEADRIGIELAARAGYNPKAATSLWKKMANLGGDSPPQFLSTHPAPEIRQKTLANLAPEMMQYYEPKSNSPMYMFKN